MFYELWDFLVAQMVKRLPVMRETVFNPRVRKIPWRRKWQPSPVLLPRKIPWMKEPGGLQSMGSQGVGHDWETSLTHSLNCSLFNLQHLYILAYGVPQSETCVHYWELLFSDFVLSGTKKILKSCYMLVTSIAETVQGPEIYVLSIRSISPCD